MIKSFQALISQLPKSAMINHDSISFSAVQLCDLSYFHLQSEQSDCLVDTMYLYMYLTILEHKENFFEAMSTRIRVASALGQLMSGLDHLRLSTDDH